MSSFKQFLGENKLWWIAPIVIVLILVGWLLLQTGTEQPTDANPFVYDAY